MVRSRSWRTDGNFHSQGNSSLPSRVCWRKAQGEEASRTATTMIEAVGVPPAKIASRLNKSSLALPKMSARSLLFTNATTLFADAEEV